MNQLFIVIPAHNRRAITLRCLQRLETTGVLTWARAIVVDDGSTDGTAEAIAESHPDVIVLRGDGNLWWTGGIRLGMQHACEQGADAVAWLNDDCQPNAGVLRRLAEHAEKTGAIAAGWARTPSGGFYAGMKKTWWGMHDVPPPAEDQIVRCDAACGNCVVIPRKVIDTIGLPDAKHLPHGLADCDYLLDATRRGFRVDLVGAAGCRNEDNLQYESSSWLLSERSPWAQWRYAFRSLKSYLYIPTGLHFHFKHWGVWGLWLFGRKFLKLFAVCLIRLLVPLSWLRRLMASRSKAFQRHEYHRRPSADRAV